MTITSLPTAVFPRSPCPYPEALAKSNSLVVHDPAEPVCLHIKPILGIRHARDGEWMIFRPS